MYRGFCIHEELVVRKLGLNSELHGMRTYTTPPHRRTAALFFLFFFRNELMLGVSTVKKKKNVDRSCRRSDGPPSPRHEAECRSAAGVGNEFQLACVSCHTA